MISSLRVVRDPNGLLTICEIFTDPTSGEVIHHTAGLMPAGYCEQQLKLELELFQRALSLPILTICNGRLLT